MNENKTFASAIDFKSQLVMALSNEVMFDIEQLETVKRFIEPKLRKLLE